MFTNTIAKCINKQDKKHITLCPTNLAALLVGGMTIHRFAAKLKKQAQIQTLDLDYIFVDEVSMLGAFEALEDAVCRPV